jgi:hypothetical protein
VDVPPPADCGFATPECVGEISQDSIVGSASVHHRPTGLFLTFAAGERDWEDNVQVNDTPLAVGNQAGVLNLSTERYFYIKSGIFQKFFELGPTSLYGEYYNIDDVGFDFQFNATGITRTNRESATMWGLGLVQHIDAAAMELYAAYRHYDAGTLNDPFTAVPTASGTLGFLPQADVEMDMVLTGARIQF